MKTREDYRNHHGEPDVPAATVDTAIALQSIASTLTSIDVNLELIGRLYKCVHQGDAAKGGEGPAEYTEGTDPQVDALLEAKISAAQQEGREARDGGQQTHSEGQEDIPF